MSVFSTRLRKGWLAWLILPVLLARALVPAGYMVASAHGNLAVVLCESSASHPHHPAHAHHHSGPHASDPGCPFAQSAGAAPLPALPSLGAPPLAVRDAAPADHDQTYAPPGPTREYPARAPPVLA